jgi:hypothetical protein
MKKLLLATVIVCLATSAIAQDWEYSLQPPQDWLNGCIALVQSENLKYQHIGGRGSYLPPRSTCHNTWKDPAVQGQYHTDPVYGKNGSERGW